MVAAPKYRNPDAQVTSPLPAVLPVHMPQVMPLSPLPQDTELQVAPPFTAAVVVASAPETVPQAVQSEVVMHTASMSQHNASVEPVVLPALLIRVPEVQV